MKTRAIALSGLVLTLVLGLSSTGCRITHYGPPAGALTPPEEAVCRATCDQMIERQAISLDEAKACLASCRTPASAKAAKATPVIASAEEDNREARATALSQGEESDCPDGSAEEPCRSARGPSCGCGKGQRAVDGHCRKRASAPPRAPEPPAAPRKQDTGCQGDWECPEDTSCDSGVCR